MSDKYEDRIARQAREEHELRESFRRRKRQLRKGRKSAGKPKSIRAQRYAQKREAQSTPNQSEQ